MSMSITQILAHWMVSLGLPVPLSVFLALVTLVVVPLVLGLIGVELLGRRQHRKDRTVNTVRRRGGRV